MKPSEIRRELLEQHGRIRIMTEVTENIARGARAGAGGDLHDCVVRLTDAVEQHNAREEALLRDLLPSLDASGECRRATMTGEHLQEHARLDTALRGVLGAPPEVAAVGVIALVRLIREHMDREETAFLNAAVLHDGAAGEGPSGG